MRGHAPGTSRRRLPGSRPRRCPGLGAGTQAVGRKRRTRSATANPSRRRPAAARTSASCSPASSLRSRVSRLPRIGVNRAPGKQPRQLRDAADAAGADRRRAAEQRHEIFERVDGPAKAGHDVGVCPASAGRATPPHRAGPRAAAPPPMASPSGRTAGMSLLLCTARSISPREQRVLDLLDEQPLAADLRERRILQPIAGGLDDDDARHGGPPRGGDARGDGVRLPQRELAAARSEPELVRGRRTMAQFAGPLLRTRERLDAPIGRAGRGSSSPGGRLRRGRRRGRTAASALPSRRRPCRHRRATSAARSASAAASRRSGG